MRFPLGIPESVAGATLPRRLLWLNLIRLIVLTILLVLTGTTFAGRYIEWGTESSRLALTAVAISYGLAGISTAMIRSGLYLEAISHLHLVVDQITWTILIYVSGGINSAATPFYGLTCVAGAILTGLRGASIGAMAAIASYGVMSFGFLRHWLTGPADQPSSAYRFTGEDLGYRFGLNALGIVVVTLLAGYLAERLRLTGGKLAVAEERAAQAERMAALGQLATGLAHEIRNPLGSISGCIQLLQTSAGLDREEKKLCTIIQSEAARLNDLVTDMLDLARPRKPNIAQVDAVAIVTDVAHLAAASGRAVSDVQIRLTVGESRIWVAADASQLRQLVWNLVRNAVQASAAGDEVTVELDQSDGHATLKVIDRGVGIDASAQQFLFDAFFTTRSHGTGVGLAVVKRIADEHGFSVKVESAQGRGAAFIVDLGPVSSLSS